MLIHNLIVALSDDVFALFNYIDIELIGYRLVRLLRQVTGLEIANLQGRLLPVSGVAVILLHAVVAACTNDGLRRGKLGDCTLVIVARCYHSLPSFFARLEPSR